MQLILSKKRVKRCPDRFQTQAATTTTTTGNPYICGQTYNGTTYTSQWVGNTPPNCTSTGMFRTVYSVPQTEAAGAYLALPSANSGSINMPKTTTPQDIGFIYIEGWPGSSTGNSEGGFQYSALNDHYTPYIRTNNPHYSYGFNYSVLPQTEMWLRVGAVSDSSKTTTLYDSKDGGPPIGTSCANGCLALTFVYASTTCGQGSPQAGYCTDVERVRANQWSQNCCVFGRSTTIGTKNAYAYLGGYTFGGIGWSNAKTDYYPSATPPPGQGQPFAYAGAISYPNSTSFVSVSQVSSPASGEVDTIYAPTSY